MNRIDKRYEIRVPREEEKQWCNWFPYFTGSNEAETKEELEPILKELMASKDSVNRKLHIKEEFRIAEFTPAPVKPKKEKQTRSKKK